MIRQGAPRTLAFLILILSLLWTVQGSVLSAVPGGSAAAPAWEPFCTFGSELFPSYLVTVSMLNSTEEIDNKAQPNILGSLYGALAVRVKAPADGTAVKIVMEGEKFIRKSTFEGVLKKGGQEYEIYPYVKYDYDALLSVHQAVPEDLTVAVWLNGEALGEQTMTLRVRTINDCVFEIVCSDTTDDISWSFSAYVNETHPALEPILKSALQGGSISSFAGYQGDKESVRAEIEAIWNALKQRGIKYSDISTPVARSDYVACQHVRLLGESINYGQANCVDGTVLLASLLRKIGLKTYLMLTSDHAFLGVDLTEDGKNRIYIETTLIDEGTLDEAIEAGRDNVKEYGGKKDLTTVDVDEWRDRGVMPLKDTEAEKR
ncbi:MAG: hypothetical protein RDV48_24390 [Candidatus Eremiobacteraeota bacterium]|nr:hypothetical protein [Candidatus Eremiobacteraeota bacterium]